VTTSEWNTGSPPDPETPTVREVPGTGGAPIPPSHTDRTFTIDEQVSGSAKEKPKPSTTHTIVSWGITIVIAIVATLAVRAWVFEQYSIPSPSMVPTLDVGDRVLVSKLNRTPGRGDIVVFNRPSNDPPQSPDDPKVLIKRVIGLPGETVEARDGKVYVDGNALDERYLPKGTVTTIAKPITVPKGEILVLGDNRGVSQDGRYFGPIPENLIVGRAILRIWPLSRFGTL
jgi:signal peptidase I